MDRVAVNSSNVVAVGYDPKSSTLEVEFKSGSIYQYFSVAANHYRALGGGSVSVGRYLNTEIKPRHRYRKVV